VAQMVHNLATAKTGLGLRIVDHYIKPAFSLLKNVVTQIAS